MPSVLYAASFEFLVKVLPERAITIRYTIRIGKVGIGTDIGPRRFIETLQALASASRPHGLQPELHATLPLAMPKIEIRFVLLRCEQSRVAEKLTTYTVGRP